MAGAPARFPGGSGNGGAPSGAGQGGMPSLGGMSGASHAGSATQPSGGKKTTPETEEGGAGGVTLEGDAGGAGGDVPRGGAGGAGGAGEGGATQHETDEPDAALVIGVQGGKLALPDGSVTIDVPPGALSADTKVTLSLVNQGAPPGAVGPVVEIGPTGTAFLEPVLITIQYDPARLGATDPGDLQLASYRAGAWEPAFSSTIASAVHRVSGLTTHLSPYAIVPAVQAPCDCHVDDFKLCCGQGAFTGSTASCTCMGGPTYEELVQCYAARLGAKQTANFCSGSLQHCCSDVAGSPRLGCTCLVDSFDQVVKVEQCAKEALGTGTVASVCTSYAGGPGGTPSQGDPAGCTEACVAARGATNANLIDDFEDSDVFSAKVGARNGWWYTANDGTVPGSPAQGVPLQETACHGGKYCIRTAGAGSSIWGAALGVTFNTSCTAACSYDASTYQGVRFWARGTGKVRADIGTYQTKPADQGGGCLATPELACDDLYGTDITLHDAWTLYQLPFASMTQLGWGLPAAFDLSKTIDFVIAIDKDQSFDFVIDDVSFY